MGQFIPPVQIKKKVPDPKSVSKKQNKQLQRNSSITRSEAARSQTESTTTGLMTISSEDTGTNATDQTLQTTAQDDPAPSTSLGGVRSTQIRGGSTKGLPQGSCSLMKVSQPGLSWGPSRQQHFATNLPQGHLDNSNSQDRLSSKISLELQPDQVTLGQIYRLGMSTRSSPDKLDPVPFPAIKGTFQKQTIGWISWGRSWTLRGRGFSTSSQTLSSLSPWRSSPLPWINQSGKHTNPCSLMYLCPTENW